MRKAMKDNEGCYQVIWDSKGSRIGWHKHKSLIPGGDWAWAEEAPGRKWVHLRLSTKIVNHDR